MHFLNYFKFQLWIVTRPACLKIMLCITIPQIWVKFPASLQLPKLAQPGVRLVPLVIVQAPLQPIKEQHCSALKRISSSSPRSCVFEHRERLKTGLKWSISSGLHQGHERQPQKVCYMTTKTSKNFSGIAAFYLYKFPWHFHMHTEPFPPFITRFLCIALTCYETAAVFQSRQLDYNGGLSYSHVMDQLPGSSILSEKQKLLVREACVERKQLGSSVAPQSSHSQS